MVQPRNDSRARPPLDKYGQLQVTFPSPNRDDLVLIEDLPWKDWTGEVLDYGTPHPKDSTARLVWQGPAKGNGQERNWRLIYANKRNAQDAYNALSEVDRGSQAYIRRYIVPRDQFAAATLGQPLKSLTGLVLGAGGSGYPEGSEITVVFTGGGGGTGAQAKATVQRGVIVALTLTNAGTGYTSAPTISFTAATGTGATATATIQDPTAILTDEKVEPLEDPQLAGLFLSVTRIYHKLPGLEIVSFGVDEETRVPIKVIEQLVETPASPYTQVPYSSIEFRPINSVYGVKITTTINNGAAIAGRTERRNVEYTFPALLFGITGTTFEARDGTPVLTTQSVRRSAFSRICSGRVAITYGPVGTLSSPAVFSPRFNDVVYDGIAFNINERNVLNDAFTPSYTSGTTNAKWPFFVEGATVSATSPSATAYTAMIGTTEICISAVIKPWKLGLERMEVIYVTAQ